MQSINCPCKDFSSVFLTMAKCLVGKDVTCVITNNESLPEQLGISVFTGSKSFVLPFNQHILHARNYQKATMTNTNGVSILGVLQIGKFVENLTKYSHIFFSNRNIFEIPSPNSQQNLMEDLF